MTNQETAPTIEPTASIDLTQKEIKTLTEALVQIVARGNNRRTVGILRGVIGKLDTSGLLKLT